jgi:hypothetical protein
VYSKLKNNIFIHTKHRKQEESKHIMNKQCCASTLD